MYNYGYQLSNYFLYSWLIYVVPLTVPCVFRKFELGDALNSKLEAGVF